MQENAPVPPAQVLNNIVVLHVEVVLGFRVDQAVFFNQLPEGVLNRVKEVVLKLQVVLVIHFFQPAVDLPGQVKKEGVVQPVAVVVGIAIQVFKKVDVRVRLLAELVALADHVAPAANFSQKFNVLALAVHAENRHRFHPQFLAMPVAPLFQKALGSAGRKEGDFRVIDADRGDDLVFIHVVVSKVPDILVNDLGVGAVGADPVLLAQTLAGQQLLSDRCRHPEELVL